MNKEPHTMQVADAATASRAPENLSLIHILTASGQLWVERFVAALFYCFWTLCPEAGRRKSDMESMRDVNRVMEREIAKGSSPLKLDLSLIHI